MVDYKISGLPPATTINGAELMEAVQSGVNVQTTISGISTFISASIPSGISRAVLRNQTGSVLAGSTAKTDYVYIFINTGTLTLPTAVGNFNLYTVKNSGATNINVAFVGGQNADGSTSISIIPGQSLDFISNNSNYVIV